LPHHAELNFNNGASLYGILASFNGVVVMLFTPFITTVFHDKTNIRTIFYGGVLYINGFGMLGFISTKSAFFVSVLVFTIGEILITISFMPFIANHTPASHRGRMSSVLPLIMGLGHMLSPLIMGKVIKIVSIETGWKIIGLIMIIATSLMLLLEKMDNKHEKSGI